MPPLPGITDYRVFINDSWFPVEFQYHLTSITVEQDLQLPSLFQLEFSALDWSSWSDSNFDNLKLLQPGNPIEIQISISKKAFVSVIEGEILGLEPNFSSGDSLSLTVWGCDYLNRLQRGTKTRSFVEMKDSDIVKQIAVEVGLNSSAITTQYKHPYLMQSNQSDLQFLQARAQQIGYELYTEGKKLFFQPLMQDKESRFSFDFGIHLLDFRPRLSLAGQVAQITVGTWDANQKTTALETIAEDPGSPLFTVLGDGKTQIVDRPVAASEVRTVAQAQADQTRLNLITGEASCFGEPGLKPGQQVQLNGLGQIFSGQYFVTSVTHRYDSDGEYRTDFKVKRNLL